MAERRKTARVTKAPLATNDPSARAVAQAARQSAVGNLASVPGITGVATATRKTVDSLGVFFGSTPVIVPPPNYEGEWQVFNLDANTFAKLGPQALVNRMIELSPDISRALWDYLRLFNPGWTLTCFNVGTDSQNTRAQAIADAIVAKLNRMYGTVDVLHGRMGMSMFLRGALFSELVLALNGRDFVDMPVIDPVSVRFRRMQDDERGQYFELGQMQVTGYVQLDQYETITYIPVDPSPDTPYGRPMVSPAIFASLFLLGLLHDLRRVIAQQGYPRIDITVDLSALFDEAKKAMPSIVNNPTKYGEWVSKVFDGIKDVYANLQPDDAYIHGSSVTVNKPVGTADPSSLGAIPSIIEIIERWLVRALKTMPLLMATRQSTSETQANREWEIHAAGIKSLQHYAEVIWERHMSLALRAQGIQCDVQFRYAELRASEMMRDQQTMQLLIQNAFAKYALGVEDIDAMATEIAGHPAVEEEPLFIPKAWSSGAPTPAEQQNPDGTEIAAGEGGDKARVIEWMPNPNRLNITRKIDGAEYVPVQTMTNRGRVIMWRKRGTREIRAPGGATGKIESHGAVLAVPDVKVDKRSLRKAVTRFDDSVPDWAGILDAREKTA
jgi:hypothetical protein